MLATDAIRCSFIGTAADDANTFVVAMQLNGTYLLNDAVHIPDHSSFKKLPYRILHFVIQKNFLK